MSRQYRSPEALRVALETRLKYLSLKTGSDLQRLRVAVSFDRFLARVSPQGQQVFALKGGYALELQLDRARATRDLDLTLPTRGGTSGENEDPHGVRGLLQDTASLPLPDHFRFLIGEAGQDLEGAPYGGWRYPVEARMAGRPYSHFHVDVGIGDVVLLPLQTLPGRDWLDFAGVSAPVIRTIGKEQQFAEKLHAYTLPRSHPNSRTKDLVDMALLVLTNKLDPVRARTATDLTFRRRNSHPVPATLPVPPEDWRVPLEATMRECGHDLTMDAAFQLVQHFCQACRPVEEERAGS